MAPSTRNSNRSGFGTAAKRGWNSKPAGIAAIVVVVLAVLVVLLSTALGVFAPANKGQGNASKPAPTSSAAGTGGPCNVRVTDKSSTPKIPSDLTWKTGAEGLTWPVSKSVGPTKMIDGFDACFARSPLGAALAAETATYSQYDPAHSVTAALNFYIADSKGKAANVEGTAKNSDASQLRSAGMNPAGFIVDSFTPNTADLTLVFSTTSTSTGYVGIPCSVRWVGGDWKLSVLDNGELSSGNPTTPSQGDFVAWGGDTP